MTILRNRDLWPIHWNIRLDLLEGWLQYVSDPFSGRVVETSIREQLMHRPTQHKTAYTKRVYDLYATTLEDMMNNQYREPCLPNPTGYDYALYTHDIAVGELWDALSGWYEYVSAKLGTEERFSVEYKQGVEKLLVAFSDFLLYENRYR